MSVIIQMWKRLAPSRTKKLSTSWVMILRLTGRGKVAHCGLVKCLHYLLYIYKSYVYFYCCFRWCLESCLKKEFVTG